MLIEPFCIDIPDSALQDLRHRLLSTRLTAPLTGQGWSEGMNMEVLRDLIAYWSGAFDWRAREAELNRLPQFTADIAGQRVHFLHQRGVGPNPMPLILTHGWPGSFIEMQRIIPLLTDPASHGGDPTDAFHVVVPSLPGYTFSAPFTQSGMGPYEVAGVWRALMSGLGYERFGAQGGDLGAGVSTWLGVRFPEHVTGIHLNYIPGSYRPPLDETAGPQTEEERLFLQRAAQFGDAEGAYAHVQRTKPQSLAVGLNDSPAGLLAWMGENTLSWCDIGVDGSPAIDHDWLLTNATLYWLTNCIGSSFLQYVAGSKRPLQFLNGERVKPPVGVAVFPRELPMPPRSWVQRCYNVERWTMMPRGGHFAALEQPQLLAEDIRAFFRTCR
ncbi:MULTISPECIES: epoxide hydrolase family protein [Pseudomonas]|uniref:epoxide hydrolase family protein n=1 Tax=Pseudomonas TaxID=286 RepID=UPI001BEB1D38|nr:MULTISPECIES: epoxide hydrolase family protein [Pseudomonas]MBT2339801.1 epoxide hydrolase [Pseudomonas fluorescens]MCD4529550.1 epoxide hydrolase [Pseudomonas sp. C3-2018]